MERRTYGKYSQSDLGLTDEVWSDLCRYVSDIRTALTSEANNEKAKAVDDPPPYISEDGEFCPSGWVGHYPGGVVIVPGKLGESEFGSMLDDVKGWSELLGATTIGSAFPLGPELLVDARTELASYSRALIEYTELLRARRLPVEISMTEYRDNRPRGRPVPTATMRESMRGSEQIVSRSIEFSFESLPNYFLIRFHAELADEMQSLVEEYTYYEAAFGDHLAYHEEFITSGVPGELLNEAIQTDVHDPEVIDRALREAESDMAEVLDLWQAYQRDIGFEMSITEHFDTAVKPVSKTYELWCLGLLLEILETITGEEAQHRHQVRGTYEFGADVTLYYDRTIDSHSMFLYPVRGISPGRPDFALERDGQIIWLGDAKFKQWSTIDESDYVQVLRYVSDLLGRTGSASILYVGETYAAKRDTLHDQTISHLTLRPDTERKARRDLEAILSTVL